MIITDKEIIEQDGFTFHLPPKVDGQTHWQIDVLRTESLSADVKEFQVEIKERENAEDEALL